MGAAITMAGLATIPALAKSRPGSHHHGGGVGHAACCRQRYPKAAPSTNDPMLLIDPA